MGKIISSPPVEFGDNTTGMCGKALTVVIVWMETSGFFTVVELIQYSMSDAYVECKRL